MILDKIRSKKDPNAIGAYIRKNDEGRYLFYPWGYTGESYFVEENLAKLIDVKSKILFCTFVALITILNLLYRFHDAVDLRILSALGTAMFISFFIVFNRMMKRFISIAEHPPKPSKSRFPFISKVLIFMIGIDLLSIYILYSRTIFAYPIFSLFMIAVKFLWSLILVISVFRLYKAFNKGRVAS